MLTSSRISSFSCPQGNGPHIYQTCPSANSFDCKAMAIGARSQSARTYLEKHLDEFGGASYEDLVRHGLRALRDTLPNEVELTSKVNTAAPISGPMDEWASPSAPENVSKNLQLTSLST